MTNDLVLVTEDNEKMSVSARELHKVLEATERFQNWFDRYSAYGLEEGVDYLGCKVFNTLAKQELQDYSLTIDAAKQICMLQRSEKGKEYRAYLVNVEKAWNTPEAVMARAYQMSKRTIEKCNETIKQLTTKIEEDKPKVATAELFVASKDSISVRQFSMILCSKGYRTGRTRLFQWFRDNGYLDANNIPYSKYSHLFDVMEDVNRSSRNFNIKIHSITYITPKGQSYFAQKLLFGIEEPSLF